MVRDNTGRDEPLSGLPIRIGEDRISRMEKALEGSGYNLPKGLSCRAAASLILSIYDPVKSGTDIWYIGSGEKVTLGNFPTEVLSKRLGIKLFETKGNELVETSTYSEIKRVLES